MNKATEAEIRSAYAGAEVAAQYIQRRFQNELHGLLHDRQRQTVQLAINRIRPQQTLEIAPGPGRLTRGIAPIGRLVCLELNEGMIAQGRMACHSSTNWVRGNAFELPFERTFDLVYSFRFIRHFRAKDRRRLYAQISKVLRPGAWLILDAVNGRVSRPMREANPAAYPIYDKLYRDEMELHDELGEAGFDVVNLTPVQRCYAAQYKAQVLLGPRSRRLCRLAIRTLERFSRSEPLEWIVTCHRA
jgi:ubiquinone/menaquinone biosynthesis C-methylase UbiE